MKHIVTALLVLMAFGCSQKSAVPVHTSGAQSKFEQIQTGMTRADVKRLTGEIPSVREAALPAGPFWGPQEGLEKIIPPNTPFEEWTYTNASHVFLVWFWSSNQTEKADWRVVGKTSHEHNVDW